MKSQKGITLISLVITIIILIILAGVSIAIVFDEDGIITKAKEAAENMEIAALEEQEMLNTLYSKFEGDIIVGDTVSANKFVELKKQYDNLNTEYSDYKTKIAEALTNKGIEASEEDDIETIVTNINNTQTGCLVYYLGTGTSFDIKSSFPNEYTNLTADNFIVETSSMSTGRQSAGSVNFYGSNGYFNSSGGTISKSYTDGVLQVSLSGLRVSASADGGSGSISTTYNFNSPKVYLVIGNIGTI